MIMRMRIKYDEKQNASRLLQSSCKEKLMGLSVVVSAWS